MRYRRVHTACGGGTIKVGIFKDGMYIPLLIILQNL